MDYQVPIEGFEGHEICLRAGSWNGRPALFFDDTPAPRGPKRNEYLLSRADGSEVLVKLRTGLFDPIPQLVIDGKVMNVTPLLTWPELIWCFLPLALVFTPGVDGLVLAFAGSWANHQIFRMERPVVQKFALAGLVTLVAAGLYFLLSGRVRLPF